VRFGSAPKSEPTCTLSISGLKRNMRLLTAPQAKSLEKLGYKVDSSVTPRIDWSYQNGPDHSKAPAQPYFIAEDDYYSAGSMKILEVPITISRKRLPMLPDKWLFYRWLRPTHMTSGEMKLLTREFIKEYNNAVLTMMFHSMEIIPKRTPFVRTKLEQKWYLSRLRSIIRYVRGKAFENKTLKELYDEISNR